MTMNRRDALRRAAQAAGVLAMSSPLVACIARQAGGVARSPDEERLVRWTSDLRGKSLTPPTVSVGKSATRVGELAVGTPYVAFALEAYLREGGSPTATEPLTLSLSHFDCVSLVESCIAIARLSGKSVQPKWEDFAREMQLLRYRGGVREGYTSRLHYFSDWIRDNQIRGGVRDLGNELGGTADTRPLRFMTEHRSSYPALAHDDVFAEIAARERGLDAHPRWVVPKAEIPAVSDRIESGDILAFATSIEGLDVTHTAFAYRDGSGVLRVLHAPLSGGVVEVTRATLPEYVAAIRRSTGILVARPLEG